jgi:hypothetical protein
MEVRAPSGKLAWGVENLAVSGFEERNTRSIKSSCLDKVILLIIFKITVGYVAAS